MTLVEGLWHHLEKVLATFASRLTRDNPTLIVELGRSSNEAFLLRGYLALRGQPGGDELAVNVDVQDNGGQLTLECDICAEDGRIVAAGPSAAISLSVGQPTVESGLASWMTQFERFLEQNESSVARGAAELS